MACEEEWQRQEFGLAVLALVSSATRTSGIWGQKEGAGAGLHGGEVGGGTGGALMGRGWGAPVQKNTELGSKQRQIASKGHGRVSFAAGSGGEQGKFEGVRGAGRRALHSSSAAATSAAVAPASASAGGAAALPLDGGLLPPDGGRGWPIHTCCEGGEGALTPSCCGDGSCCCSEGRRREGRRPEGGAATTAGSCRPAPAMGAKDSSCSTTDRARSIWRPESPAEVLGGERLPRSGCCHSAGAG